MKVHQTTIKDIAKILGISASTVSRALKDHPDISSETKEAVRRVADSVNYRPNALALGLRKAKTNIIGVVVPEMSHYFFSTVLSGMDEYAFSKGYTTMVCQSLEDAEHEKVVVQSLVDTRVDGILISLSKGTRDVSLFRSYAEEGFPIVMFDRTAEDLEVSRVTTDDFKGAYEAVSLMLRHGRRRIALLCGDGTLAVSEKRKEGYKAALRDAGIDVDEAIIFDVDTREKLIEKKGEFLEMTGEIDGVFAVNDATAVGALKMLKKGGIRVPEDVEVVGFGDDPMAEVVEPSLTSVEQNGYEMGREAMRILIEQIESGLIVTKPEVCVMEPHVKERESTGGGGE